MPFNLKSQAVKGWRTVCEKCGLDLLGTYDWPGNVRELDNVIQQLMVLASHSTITPNAVVNLVGSNQSSPNGTVRLPADELSVRENETMATWLRRVQHVLLTSVIAQYPDRTAAAKRLGLTRNALNLQLVRLRAHFDDTGTTV